MPWKLHSNGISSFLVACCTCALIILCFNVWKRGKSALDSLSTNSCEWMRNYYSDIVTKVISLANLNDDFVICNWICCSRTIITEMISRIETKTERNNWNWKGPDLIGMTFRSKNFDQELLQRENSLPILSDWISFLFPPTKSEQMPIFEFGNIVYTTEAPNSGEKLHQTISIKFFLSAFLFCHSINSLLMRKKSPLWRKYSNMHSVTEVSPFQSLCLIEFFPHFHLANAINVVCTHFVCAVVCVYVGLVFFLPSFGDLVFVILMCNVLRTTMSTIRIVGFLWPVHFIIVLSSIFIFMIAIIVVLPHYY